MASIPINPSKITLAGLSTLLMLFNFLTACNLTQAQEQYPSRSRRTERSRRMRNNQAAPNITNMALKNLTVGGESRSYYVYTPSSYKSNKQMPLVLAFHGGRGRGDHFAVNTGLYQVAERQGFIVAFPNGQNNPNRENAAWNDGRVTQASQTRVNDVAFIGAVIDDIEKDKNIDTRRIYATGTSNGGFFTQRLACQMSNRIAAFASANATLPKPLQASCNPPKPVPILMMNGTDDRIVPWKGGTMETRFGSGEIVSVPNTVEFWRKHNACSSQAKVEQLPDTQADGTTVQKEEYIGCRNGAKVVHYTIEGGGHAWPGSNEDRPALSGKINHDISASDVIWKFFQQYTLQ